MDITGRGRAARVLLQGLALALLLALCALGQAQSLPREVRSKILEAVVQVVPWDDEASRLVDWSGSGTIISPNGHVLTNFHVIGDPATRQYYDWHAIFVTRPNASDQPPQHRYWARYVSSDPTYDLALLKIAEFADEEPIPEEFAFTAMPVGDSNDLLPGDLITVVGYPGISGSTITFTAGLMSGWLGEDFLSGGKQWIKTDAKIARGNSGGAAFNERGELIGVPTAGIHRLEESLYEEQLYVRPISLAWALIGPNVPTVLRASGAQTPVTPPVDTASPPVSSTAQGSGSYGTVEIGGSQSGTIAAKPEGQNLVYHTYSVTVPEGLAELTISLDGGGRDIDLAVKAGAEITDYDDVDHLDTSPEPNPSYTYTNPPAGTIYIDVLNLLDEPIAYTLSVEASGASEPPAPPIAAGATDSTTLGPIEIGQTASGQLAGADDGVSYHTYFVDVPAGTAQLVITMNADADLDLAAKFGSEIASYRDHDNGGDWDYRDNSAASSAEFVIDNPQAGPWYIDVYNALQSSVTGSYSLTVEAGSASATAEAETATAPTEETSATEPPAIATEGNGVIALGESVSGELTENHHTYVVDVPEGLSQLVISMNGHTDLGLAAKFGSKTSSYRDQSDGGDWDYRDTNMVDDAQFIIDRPQAGHWYIDVYNTWQHEGSFLGFTYSYSLSVEAGEVGATSEVESTTAPSEASDATTSSTSTTTDAPPAIIADTTGSTTVGAISIGQTASGQLAGEDGSVSYHTYFVDIPEGTPRLVITMNADADLDLAAKFGSEIASYRDHDNGGDWDYRDNSAASSAEFIIDNPQAGRLYIDVYNALQAAVTGGYTLSIR